MFAVLAVVGALVFVSGACSGSDGELSAPTTLVTVDNGVTTADDATTDDVSVDTVASADDDVDPVVSSQTDTESTDSSDEVDAAGTDDSTDTTATFTSSPPPAEDKVGCPEGLILVGSNGEEPICSTPGSGCPDGYGLIGGVDGAALCQGDDGSILRVYPDGTITPDTSVPFNGPVCRRLDDAGNLVELGLATSQADCESRGGEYLPDGLP
jgi:hypothetical protein